MIRLSLICPFLLVVAACSIAPEIPLQALPAPAMEKLPVHVALITDDAFRNYAFDGPLFSKAMVASDSTLKYSRLHYELGEMNVDLFTQVSSSLFAQVTRFDSWEHLNASGGSFDGVLVPSVAFFGAGPSEYDVIPVLVDVTYELLFFDQQEQQILDWKVVSQKLFCQGQAICHYSYKDFMPVVEREIAARILSQFPEFPEITDWVKSVESGR